jgi:hypothetical protein
MALVGVFQYYFCGTLPILLLWDSSNTTFVGLFQYFLWDSFNTTFVGLF